MITLYGMKTCPYCEYVEAQIEKSEELKKKFKIVDIGAHILNLKRFMHLRDTNPAFDEAKRIGDVGIPCYVLEDGTVTLNSTDVGLVPMPDEPEEGASCSIDGKGC